MKSPSRPVLVASLSVLAALLASAQTATDPDEGLRLVPDPVTPHAYEVSWWGKTGRTYFIGHTDDLLATWSYFPAAEFGQDAIIRYGFTHTAPKVFVRLNYYDEVLADPLHMDSDGDGLSNFEEMALGTDPFSADTDGDGMPDGWEIANGLDPLDPTDALTDPDGDGRSSAQEFLEGTDPLVADAAPPPSGPTPAAPDRPTVQKLSPTSYRIAWSSGATPMLGYLVERSTDNVTWHLLGFTTGNTTSYDDSSTLPGIAYSYRIKGVY